MGVLKATEENPVTFSFISFRILYSFVGNHESQTMNLKISLVFLLLGFLSRNTLAAPNLTPPDASADDFSTHQAMLNQNSCEKMDDTCAGCLTIPDCKFASFNNSETKCVSTNVTEDSLRKSKPGFKLEDVVLSEDKCPQSSDDGKPATAIPPKFDTSLTPENENATTTPTTVTTASSSSTTTTVTTTTKITTTTSVPTTTETTASPLISTTTDPVDPSGKSGSKFDGWSFFGGILLTIGLSAIGFVSFKYYKVRSGGNHAGTNYNRF